MEKITRRFLSFFEMAMLHGLLIGYMISNQLKNTSLAAGDDEIIVLHFNYEEVSVHVVSNGNLSNHSTIEEVILDGEVYDDLDKDIY